MRINGLRRLPQERFDEIYAEVPRTCVDIALIGLRGVLLTKRALPSWKDQWHFPGSTLFYGERLKDAASRVALEELGTAVYVHDQIGTIEYPSEQNGWPISIVFTATMVWPDRPDKPITLDHQATHYGFFTEPPSDMLAEHEKFFRDKQDVLMRAIEWVKANGPA